MGVNGGDGIDDYHIAPEQLHDARKRSQLAQHYETYQIFITLLAMSRLLRPIRMDVAHRNEKSYFRTRLHF